MLDIVIGEKEISEFQTYSTTEPNISGCEGHAKRNFDKYQ